jgi:hypothetical protein
MYGGEGGARGIMLAHELNKIFNQNQNKTDQWCYGNNDVVLFYIVSLW